MGGKEESREGKGSKKGEGVKEVSGEIKGLTFCLRKLYHLTPKPWFF